MDTIMTKFFYFVMQVGNFDNNAHVAHFLSVDIIAWAEGKGSLLRVKRAACEGVRWMGRFWSWWHEMPCDPIRLAQRTDQIVRASLCITGINIAILLVHLLIVWWLFLNKM